MPNDHGRGLFPRFAAEVVATALRDTPASWSSVPDRCGKATLVRDFLATEREFLTLDDETSLAAARGDPAGMVRDFDRITIDEVQRAPDLLRAIKRSVDDNRRAGQFLLTGSANILSLPRISDRLAGRMEIVILLPLSQAELRRIRPSF